MLDRSFFERNNVQKLNNMKDKEDHFEVLRHVQKNLLPLRENWLKN